MKICDLTQFYSPVSGGVKRYLSEKSAYVRQHEPDSRHVIIVPGPDSTRTVDGPTTFYTIGSPVVSRTSRYRVLTRLHLVEEILEREEPDIIESSDPYQVAWKAVASGRALDIPVVGFYHSHFAEAYIRSLARYFGRIALSIAQEVSERYVTTLYNRFERTFVPSPALAQLLRNWGVERVDTLELGVNTDAFRPDAARGRIERRRLGIADGATVLLYVGRLAAEKNVRTLLDAFSLLCARGTPPVHLIVAGDGLLRSAVQRTAEETGSLTHVPYREEAADLADLYRAADLFVHPSVNETFGLVALESQACGVPVIGIRGSYMDRIIFSGRTHWARENTAEALADAIVDMTRMDMVSCGLTAAAAVHARYGWRAVFDKLFSIYRSVIAEY